MTLRGYFVEDSATIRDNLIDALKELAEVEAVGTADNEQAGRSWLTRHPLGWDIAIVDLFLREGNGLRVVESLRQRRTGQRVVVLSNHATPDIRRRCAQLGADAVFDKSTEIDALVDYCVKVRHELLPNAAEIELA